MVINTNVAALTAANNLNKSTNALNESLSRLSSGSKIINASESIVDGSICVENYHAILENTKSSIRESLKGKGSRVAVLGPGKLGRLAAAVLRTAGPEVALLGRASRAKPASFDLVVEATGSPAGMPRALALVRPRGTIVWKST